MVSEFRLEAPELFFELEPKPKKDLTPEDLLKADDFFEPDLVPGEDCERVEDDLEPALLVFAKPERDWEDLDLEPELDCKAEDLDPDFLADEEEDFFLDEVAM